jgi:S-DNA-T family DNA segregation ATPase FtsK/SpoIIIE
MTKIIYFCRLLAIKEKMAKKKRKEKTASFTEAIGIKNIFQNDFFNFIFGFVLILLAIYMAIAFVSYLFTGQADQSFVLDMKPGDWLNTQKEFQNSCGSMGALLSHFFICECFGLPAFVIPVLIGLVGLRMMHVYNGINLLKWFMGLVILMLWCSVTFAKFLTPIMGDQVYNPGGDHGKMCCQFLENVIGAPGLTAILALVAILFLTYISNETINVVRKMLNPIGYINRKVKFVITNEQKKDEKTPEVPIPEQEEPKEPVITMEVEEQEEKEHEPDLVMNVEDAQNQTKEAKGKGPIEIEVTAGKGDEKANGKTMIDDSKVPLQPINPKEPWTKYQYPTIDLLKKYDTSEKPTIDKEEQQANMNRILKVLNDFGVQIRSIHATVGPTITLYEITPAEGVRISRIRNLEDDIALSLSALGIRIIAPIPGKGTIGIEVPNANPQIVSMETVINSKRFKETNMDLPLALGKTITNEVFMVDLAKIPHLLVAGATGQGKSVGLNAIITSLLYKKHPNELKFVLIDPKKVEFSVYTPIVNHFMAQIPTLDENEEAIITDVTKVIKTLNSLCKLMDHRYDLLKAAGTRTVKEYNKKFLDRKLRLSDGHDFMPYIVVIIDEFGDLILTAGKEIELPIARIAQLARAVGIHMVIATQRPTTKIITGNIKANFPGRIAFKTSARIDSMTILDRTGANQLVGRGDMLYLNGGEPVRVQCAFVDTPEVEKINDFIENQPGPLEPMELPEPTTDEEDGGGAAAIDMHNIDALFEEAARLIVTTQQGSTSMIQRKFGIGYNRAGRLMDSLEKAGIVGQAMGSKPRDVLIADPMSLESKLASIRGK